MTAKTGGRQETVVEAIKAAHATKAARLAVRLVDDVDTVAATVTTRDTLRLAVETYAHTCETELTHQALLSGSGGTGHAHGCGTLHAAMAARARRSKSRRLERQDLVRRELLLVQGSLLPLKSLDLLLNGDLEDESNERGAIM